MKLCTVVLFLSLAACGKANDLPAMKAEAQGMAKNYQTKLGELDRRANHILQRGNAIGVTSPDAANASRTFATAKGRLEQLKASANNAPAEIANIKTDLEMQRYIDRASREMKEGFVAINADFTAVESWVTLAETRPNQVATKDPVVPPPAPSPESPPPPGNPGQMGAGGTTPNPPR